MKIKVGDLVVLVHSSWPEIHPDGILLKIARFEGVEVNDDADLWWAHVTCCNESCNPYESNECGPYYGTEIKKLND